MTTLLDLLDGFTSYAWRLEALDSYDVADEREQFDDFMAGRPPRPSVDDLEWQARARSVVASGRRIGRVRMVGHPVTDYTRFEWAAYPDNLAAGEEIRVYDRTWPEGTDPRFEQDFWLFDDRIAAVMNYASDGQFLGITITEDVQPFLGIKLAALEHAVPFNEYTLLPAPRSEGQIGRRRAPVTNEETSPSAH
ncbi:DUF6879 family protein [Amycolatopsis sp. NPDC051903]|uniref:DUF6879 family protein n=1 Tax=Amycolatopsis sp. NPDC051903 TaxID=3363936 RepID=UPI0037B2B52B